MNQFTFLIMSIAIVLAACNQDNEIKLKENDNEKMTYYASKKRGYRMSILKHVRGLYIEYAVRLNGNGEIMYVYKTPITSDSDPAGSTQYLVSDTTDSVEGAKLFDRAILGYYDSKAMNFISSNNYKGKSSLFLPEEKSMFSKIDSLMKQQKLVFIPFDSSRTLFWFKYDLQ